jgi:hypothetical protein
MRAPTLTAATLAAAAALLLSACGSDAQQSDTIKGAQSGAAPSPGATAADAAHRPKITLPPDVHDVFENTSTGDPTKDAIWADAAQRILAVDAATVEAEPRSPAVLFYSAGVAQASAYQLIQGYIDQGHSITGTTRYYSPDITVHGAMASLDFCSDESKAFDKVRKSGKVLTTSVDQNSYVRNVTELQRNSSGVWQTTYVMTQRGAAECQP